MNAKTVSAIELSSLVPSGASDGVPLLGERLDLVEHVRVRLTVTLGGADMTLGRLFSLAAGDVVSLDRDVDAPVDVRLHDKLVARGQLVAAGDQMGVRILEILVK
jgi:flagellar motor switch protein FliN